MRLNRTESPRRRAQQAPGAGGPDAFPDSEMLSARCAWGRAHSRMRSLWLGALGLWLLLAGAQLRAQSWTEALACMPINPSVHYLDRTNCVEVMLDAFRSNGVVKGLIFMPGATDEFYMFRRAHASLTGEKLNLAEAIIALTKESRIQATFNPPFLLLHTDEDSLEPDVTVRDERTETRLKTSRGPSHVFCNDRDWDYLQPILRWSLKVDIRPWHKSPDSWHFYRHSFAAWDLTGWEALEAAALAGKSRFTVERKSVVFEVDRRVKVSPRFEAPGSKSQVPGSEPRASAESPSQHLP